MAKTNKEIEFYNKSLRLRMIAKSEILNVNWARYYANLLDLGGVNNEQYLRNFFIDDNKRFTTEQLVTILLDLEDIKDIKAITQSEMEKEVLRTVKKIGVLTSEMEKQFDNNNKIDANEATMVLNKARPLLAIVQNFVLRLEETKAKG